MERFVFSAPPTWRAASPRQFGVGAATVTVSEMAPLAENLPQLIDIELRRDNAGAALAGVEVSAFTLASGWPALAAEAALGDSRRMVMSIQFLHLGVLVQLDGPAESFAATRSQVIEALGRGTVDWGEPSFLTLAELLEGVRR